MKQVIKLTTNLDIYTVDEKVIINEFGDLATFEYGIKLLNNDYSDITEGEQELADAVDKFLSDKLVGSDYNQMIKGVF